jgi:hypothetical protein
MPETKTNTGKEPVSKKHTPTRAEVERLVKETFPSPNSMCPVLCTELQLDWELVERPGLSEKEKGAIVAKIHVISAELERLKCRCFPE